MRNTINTLLVLILLSSMYFSTLHAITADELLNIHKATNTEMNNINSPQAGSLVYNTTDDTLYFYAGTVWKRLRSNGSDTIINAGNNIVIAGNGSSATPYIIGQ